MRKSSSFLKGASNWKVSILILYSILKIPEIIRFINAPFLAFKLQLNKSTQPTSYPIASKNLNSVDRVFLLKVSNKQKELQALPLNHFPLAE